MDRVTVAEIFRHSKFSTLEVGRSSILLFDKLGTYSARAVNIRVVIIIGFASMQLINRKASYRYNDRAFASALRARDLERP